MFPVRSPQKVISYSLLFSFHTYQIGLSVSISTKTINRSPINSGCTHVYGHMHTGVFTLILNTCIDIHTNTEACTCVSVCLWVCKCIHLYYSYCFFSSTLFCILLSSSTHSSLLFYPSVLHIFAVCHPSFHFPSHTILLTDSSTYLVASLRHLITIICPLQLLLFLRFSYPLEWISRVCSSMSCMATSCTK